jgi:hypothetical protein
MTRAPAFQIGGGRLTLVHDLLDANMTLEEAAKLLHAQLLSSPWLTAVGVGDDRGTPCVVIYVKTLKGADLEVLHEGWKGFPVVVRKMASPRLLASFGRS